MVFHFWTSSLSVGWGRAIEWHQYFPSLCLITSVPTKVTSEDHIFTPCVKIYNPEINQVRGWQLKWLVWESHLPNVLQVCGEGCVLQRTLPCLINIPLVWTTRRSWWERKIVGVHYSSVVMCHLPFKMHMSLIGALSCHKLNAKGLLLWAMAGEPNVFPWFICGGAGKTNSLYYCSSASVIILKLAPYSPRKNTYRAL